MKIVIFFQLIKTTWIPIHTLGIVADSHHPGLLLREEITNLAPTPISQAFGKVLGAVNLRGKIKNEPRRIQNSASFYTLV